MGLSFCTEKHFLFYVIRVPAYAKKGTLVPGGGVEPPGCVLDAYLYVHMEMCTNTCICIINRCVTSSSRWYLSVSYLQ